MQVAASDKSGEFTMVDVSISRRPNLQSGDPQEPPTPTGFTTPGGIDFDQEIGSARRRHAIGRAGHYQL